MANRGVLVTLLLLLSGCDRFNEAISDVSVYDAEGKRLSCNALRGASKTDFVRAAKIHPNGTFDASMSAWNALYELTARLNLMGCPRQDPPFHMSCLTPDQHPEQYPLLPTCSQAKTDTPDSIPPFQPTRLE